MSEETGLKADFVEGTVYQAPDLAPGPFDLVFTTWGTIYWLPDVKNWAKAIASVLAPGGELYFADTHPGFAVLEEYAERFVPTYDFQTPPDQPLQFQRDHVHRRPDHPLASINTIVDTLALSSPRRTDRCRTYDYDVS